jgi:hypothetical protein
MRLGAITNPVQHFNLKSVFEVRTMRIPSTARPLAIIVITVVAVLSAQGFLQAQESITVGPNVQVSKALAREAHFEIEIAADPFHANRLLACSMLFPADYSATEVVTYASLDGGRSWTPTLRTRGEAGHPSWDPACAYGPAGIAYTFSENTDEKSKSFDRLDRSTDGGKTWETPVRTKHAERNFITVDTTGGPHDGWIYLQGAGSISTPGVHSLNARAYYFQYSADGGHTFLSQLVPVADGNYNIGFGPGVVLSDGTYLAPMGEWKNYTQPDGTTRVPISVLDHDGRWANTALKVFRAKFDKPNWPLSVEVFNISDWFLDRAWNRSMMTMMAVDASQGPFRDRAYVVWPDVASGRSQILLSYTSDAGKTWSRPRVIDDDRPWTQGAGPDDIHGQVAVNPQGVVGVMWYDRRDHPDNLGWTVRFRASLDGGETFTPSVKVSEVPYRPEKTEPLPLDVMGGGSGRPNEQTQLGVHSFNFSGGHTAGLAATADGSFHPLWVGNSTGVPQLWTAAVTVAGRPEKNGSMELAKLTDVSGKVKLRFTDRKLFRKDRMVETDVQLENLSEDTFHGLLKMRVLDLNSDLGVPEIINADEGGKGEGAVFDFTSLLEGQELKPHAVTKPKHIKMRMVELDPVRPFGPGAVTSLATFNTKVLAGSVTGPSKDSPTLKPPVE